MLSVGNISFGCTETTLVLASVRKGFSRFQLRKVSAAIPIIFQPSHRAVQVKEHLGFKDANTHQLWEP